MESGRWNARLLLAVPFFFVSECVKFLSLLPRFPRSPLVPRGDSTSFERVVTPLTVGRLTFVRGGASELWIVKTLRGGAQAGRQAGRQVFLDSSVVGIDLERKALTKAFYRKRKF